jgi:two-component system, OmpR family, response regulator RegX3
MHRILVVDDDATNTKLLKFLLGDEGYEVNAVSSASSALDHISRTPYDLIMLDIMLPGMDGLELCRRIRDTAHTPIIFLSALSDTKHKVTGLRAGGDDYIAKPFDPGEVLARTGALLRRSGRAAPGESSRMRSGITLDSLEHTVTLHHTGKKVRLTPLESRLLHVLISNAGHSISRETLVIKVWGFGYERASNQLDVYISRLRTKIEPNPSKPCLLQTVRGIGYRFAADASTEPPQRAAS